MFFLSVSPLLSHDVNQSDELQKGNLYYTPDGHHDMTFLLYFCYLCNSYTVIFYASNAAVPYTLTLKNLTVFYSVCCVLASMLSSFCWLLFRLSRSCYNTVTIAFYVYPSDE